jgi:hypothetical protein
MLDGIGGFDEDFFAYGDDANSPARPHRGGFASMRPAPVGTIEALRWARIRDGGCNDRTQSRAAGGEAVSGACWRSTVLLCGAPGGGRCWRTGTGAMQHTFQEPAAS